MQDATYALVQYVFADGTPVSAFKRLNTVALFRSTVRECLAHDGKPIGFRFVPQLAAGDPIDARPSRVFYVGRRVAPRTHRSERTVFQTSAQFRTAERLWNENPDHDLAWSFARPDHFAVMQPGDFVIRVTQSGDSYRAEEDDLRAAWELVNQPVATSTSS